MTYQLRPRWWMCQCGHSATTHNTTNLIILMKVNLKGPCKICTCSNFKAETSDNVSQRSRS